MVIDHIGIVVKSLEEGISHWQTLFGYEQITEPVINTRQNVKVVFLGKEDSISVKLIKPCSEASPVYQFARRGGGLHHLCFRCEDIDTGIKNLKDGGMRLIRKPEPGEAFDDELIAFLYGNQGLNIELIDTVNKARRFQDKD